MKVFGFVLPKAVGVVLSTVLGIGVVTTGVIATVPLARIALQGSLPIVRHVPAIGPAAGLTYRVEGPSMEPTYTSGENLTMLPWTGERLQLCDVVAFRYAPNVIYLKRVVAVGPATVTWTPDSIKLKGDSVCQAYLHGGSVGSGVPSGTMSVSDGMYFVVGDNLPMSADSRVFGPIKSSDIVGYLPG